MRHHRNALAASALALPMALGAWPAHAADIVETLRESGQFSLLVRAIEQAGLAETLEGEGPFTIFAPTDGAFHRIPLGVFNALLQEDNREDLRALLEHHVIEGEELAAEQLLGQERQVGTVQGDSLTVDGTGAVVVLVPTGLSIARVGDQVFVEREVAALARPAIQVSATGEGGDEQQQQTRQQAAGASAQAQGQQQAQQQDQQDRQQQQTAAREGDRAQGDARQQQQQSAAGMMRQQQQTPTAAEGELEQLEEQYAMMRQVPLRELQQALQEARQALQQQNDWLADLNLERAELALRRSELDERREISRLLDEADQALQQDDRAGARQALQRMRQITPQEDYRTQVWRSLQETRAALGQGDRQWAGQSLGQAERAVAQAESRLAWQDGDRQTAAQAEQQQQQDQQQQRQRAPLQEQYGLVRAATVVQPDIEADNGVIHAINELLVPRDLERQLAQVLRPQEQGARQQGQQQQQGDEQQQQLQQRDDEQQQGQQDRQQGSQQ